MRSVFGLALILAEVIVAGIVRCAPTTTNAADTVSITLQQAEDQFLRNNLQLLAGRFGIGAAQAAADQAALWSNPNISIEQNAYNKYTGRFLDVTKTGNTGLQLQQLILLAGKRDKQVRLAEINTAMVRETFSGTLRALRTELRTDMFDLFYLQKSLAFYDQTLPEVRRTVAATEAIYEKRSILLAEVLRLKSLLFSLENERLDLLNRISEKENELAVLVHDTSSTPVYYHPSFDERALDSLRYDVLSLPAILASAAENRPDFRLAEQQVRYDAQNLALQKALSVPDLTVGGLYSRAGSYIPDYLAVTVSIDLPIFNRNQGNIAASEQNLEADRALREHARIEVEKEVTDAYRKAAAIDSLYRRFDKQFTGQYQTLVDGMNASYERRNITIIEFTDFYESYRTSMLQMYQLFNDRLDAFEALNYAAGTTLVGP